MTTNHAPTCIEYQQKEKAWKEEWPFACPHCHGAGAHFWQENQAPLGSGQVWLEDFAEPCSCIEKGVCPRCGEKQNLYWGASGDTYPCQICGWNWGKNEDDASPQWQCLCWLYEPGKTETGANNIVFKTENLSHAVTTVNKILDKIAVALIHVEDEALPLNEWDMSLMWCPSQCYYHTIRNGTHYLLYLRWRWSDPWQGFIFENASHGDHMKGHDGWKQDVFETHNMDFKDSEMFLAQQAIINILNMTHGEN